MGFTHTQLDTNLFLDMYVNMNLPTFDKNIIIKDHVVFFG